MVLWAKGILLTCHTYISPLRKKERKKERKKDISLQAFYERDYQTIEFRPDLDEGEKDSLGFWRWALWRSWEGAAVHHGSWVVNSDGFGGRRCNLCKERVKQIKSVRNVKQTIETTPPQRPRIQQNTSRSHLHWDNHKIVCIVTSHLIIFSQSSHYRVKADHFTFKIYLYYYSLLLYNKVIIN